MSIQIKCQIPPPGWMCTREPGHGGPCAAHQVNDEAAQHLSNYLAFVKSLTSCARKHLPTGHPVREKIEQMWEYTRKNDLQGSPLRGETNAQIL